MIEKIENWHINVFWILWFTATGYWSYTRQDWVGVAISVVFLIMFTGLGIAEYLYRQKGDSQE